MDDYKMKQFKILRTLELTQKELTFLMFQDWRKAYLTLQDVYVMFYVGFSGLY